MLLLNVSFSHFARAVANLSVYAVVVAHVSLHNYSGFFSAFIFFQRFFLFFFSWLKEKMHFGFSCARLVIKKFMHIFAFHSLVSLFLSFPLKCVNDCNGYKEMSIMITYMRDCIALTLL